MKFGAKLRHLVTRRPLAGVEPILAKLILMREKLLNLKTYCGIETIVDFFNATSAAQDFVDERIPAVISELDRINDGRYDALIDQLNKLRHRINTAGRVQGGLNRSERGSIVTDQDVFLGDIYGLWTFCVADWKKHRDEPKGMMGWPGFEEYNAYDIVSVQARDFMNSHKQALINLVDEIQKIVRANS